MKIAFERSGGFTGMLVAATIDTSELPEEEAVALHTMLDESRFFELPPRLESAVPGMDQFHYVLTVERTGEASHTVQMTDTAAPPAMQPLLRKLTLLARRQG